MKMGYLRRVIKAFPKWSSKRHEDISNAIVFRNENPCLWKWNVQMSRSRRVPDNVHEKARRPCTWPRVGKRKNHRKFGDGAYRN